MAELSVTRRAALIRAIALREGTARELATRFNVPIDELRSFATAHHDEIEEAYETYTREDTITPEQLDDLWITKKFERLKRLQTVAEIAYDAVTEETTLSGADFATVMREFRSYLTLAANELGQLLHRGSGESGTGDTLSIDIQNVDMETLR